MRELAFNDAGLLEWWGSQKQHMPCLQMVIKSLHGLLPGSGGSELDIGEFKDGIGHKQEQLNGCIQK